MVDDGAAIHYTAVEPGTPVYGSDGVQVGTVEAIVDNYREHIFDGVVIAMGEGEHRFADAPEVARTAERGVTLAISSEEATKLPPPETAAPSYKPNLKAGKVSRLFGGGWKRR